MKKLFTLLTMLVIGISGMWADDFTPDANAEYTLQCCATDHSGFIGLNNGALDGRSAIGTRFKFESATGGYYIKVVDANKYFNWNNNDAVLSEDPSTVWVVTSSQYISGKYRIAPSGTASDKGLNNNETSKVTHLKIGPFERASNTCSHWTIRAITIPSNCNAYIGGVTTGNYTIDETKWKTQGNWSLTDTWNNYGPGCSVSGSVQGMWSPIYLKDITGGTVPTLDGWNFRMTADHSTYEIAEVRKIQPECYLTLKNNSVVTMNFGSGHTFSFTVNLDEGTGNILKFNMSNGYNHFNAKTCSNECNGQITVNYGRVSKNTNRLFNASGSGSIKKLILNATLTEPTENNTVEEIPLVTYTSGVSSATVTCNISVTDGWTQVGSEAELSTQFINGMYYYVENTATGVKLHTYKETTKNGYTVAENSTETLSQIDNYENYDSYTVPSNSTLIIDIDDFNLKRIYGTGNIGITSGKTLVVNVAGFDLTRITGEGNVTLNHDASLADGKHTNATGTLTVNEGVKLSMGSGEGTNAYISSFSNVILKGILHYNTQKNEIKNLTIPENETGVIFSDDMGDEDSGNKISLTGTTTINSGANLITCNHWNFKLEISKLTGSGTWEICGTENSSYSYEHQSTERSLNIVNDASEFTGTINLNNDPSKNGDNSTVTVGGKLVGCTLKKTTGDYFYYSGANLNGTTLEGVILNGSSAITVSGDATLNFTTTTTLNNSFIINSGKTLTINGGSNNVNITGNITGTDGTLNIKMSEDDITAKLNGNASCTLIDVADGGAVNVTEFKINGVTEYPIGDYKYCISKDASNDIVLVKHYTRNVTSGRFGSICIENAALVSQMTGIEKVLKVTSVETDRVVMDEVEEMTAGVPYIFKSNADAINLTLKGENADEPVDDPEGYLVGNFAVADVPNSTSSQINYILQSNQFKKVTSETIKSGKNRCYLKVAGESSRMSTLGIAVDEDAPTGIDAINALMNNNAEIYDLNGRRLNDLRKGINIVNGVKVIVK